MLTITSQLWILYHIYSSIMDNISTLNPKHLRSEAKQTRQIDRHKTIPLHVYHLPPGQGKTWLTTFLVSFPYSKVHGANMGPTWADRTQVDPMLATWTLLCGLFITLIFSKVNKPITVVNICITVICQPYILLSHWILCIYKAKQNKLFRFIVRKLWHCTLLEFTLHSLSLIHVM